MGIFIWSVAKLVCVQGGTPRDMRALSDLLKLTFVSPVLIALLVVMCFVFPYNIRPFLKIQRYASPSLLICPLWLVAVVCLWIATATVPDRLNNGTATATNEAFLGQVPRLAVGMSILHSIMTCVRLGCGLTVAKWPALVMCETAKGITVAMFLAGVLSLRDAGDTSDGTVFFIAVCVAVAALLAVSL